MLILFILNMFILAVMGLEGSVCSKDLTKWWWKCLEMGCLKLRLEKSAEV